MCSQARSHGDIRSQLPNFFCTPQVLLCPEKIFLNNIGDDGQKNLLCFDRIFPSHNLPTDRGRELFTVVDLGLGARGKVRKESLMTSSYSANRDKTF